MDESRKKEFAWSNLTDFPYTMLTLIEGGNEFFENYTPTEEEKKREAVGRHLISIIFEMLEILEANLSNQKVLDFALGDIPTLYKNTTMIEMKKFYKKAVNLKEELEKLS